ncbi:5233_t:CDS:2 [Ambispora gerdemannii]|uniref:5233_t:CDS:1 n=1 Tax=Ambispora gerdemannii TaxID=144530 RepID=A0A9N8WSU2_9GLOM|nr:5233_t:CDS:2 [Ambispora gerdemannii]
MSNQHVFQAFESYDFDRDPNFQVGLSAIHNSIVSKSAKEANQMLEKAKCFYYSKTVEKIDYDSYILWKNSQKSSSLTSPNKNNLDDDSGRGEGKIKSESIPTTKSSSSTETRVNADDSMSNDKKDQEELGAEINAGGSFPGDTDNNTPKYPHSFQEICEMIANGTPIPVKHIPNEINKESPKEAQFKPRPKPWEREK